MNMNETMSFEEAMAFLKRCCTHGAEQVPDLVILDLNLPKKNGRAVLAELKSNPEYQKIPVVVFSTSQLGSDICSSYELGANCYVRKPGNLKDFVSAVKAIEEFWFVTTSLPQ